jgi:hypothetical protein
MGSQALVVVVLSKVGSEAEVPPSLLKPKLPLASSFPPKRITFASFFFFFG